MKIEKISDNQIRCTLNKKDLMDRQLKISELAYGSEKAKALFRDMMQQASMDFGFEAEDIPLMIEAIPISKETIILVITKVNDPEEIENRFAKLTSHFEKPDNTEQDTSFSDELLQVFSQLNEILESNQDAEDTALVPVQDLLTQNRKKKKPVKRLSSHVTSQVKVFEFSSLEDIIQLSEKLVSYFTGQSSVYKDEKSSKYFLLLFQFDTTIEEMNQIYDRISEYGKLVPSTYATKEFMDEHYVSIIQNDAIQILSVM